MLVGSVVAMTSMLWGCDGHTPVMSSAPNVASVAPNDTAGAPNSSSYNEEVALTYANLAIAAFCGTPHLPDFEALEAWRCGPPCDAVPNMGSVRSVSDSKFDNAFAFVGRLADECVVSFRGTDNFAGWISDLESGHSVKLSDHGIPCEWLGRKCKVGLGFVTNYLNVREYLFGNLTEIGCEGRPVSVVGHSLGGAIAVLALFDLLSQGYSASDSYTFGQPRVGDYTFVQALNASLGEAKIFRVTKYKDPVPHLSPEVLGFKHHGQEVYFAGDTADGFKVCDGSGEDPLCADQWSGVFGLPEMLAACMVGDVVLADCDHMTYMKSALPYNMGPVSCQADAVVSLPLFVA